MIRLYLRTFLTLLFAAVVLLGTNGSVGASGVPGCTPDGDTGCGNQSEIFAISHGYPDGSNGTISRKSDIWYRITIAPWTPCNTESATGTCADWVAWDGKSNGFYYQVSLSSASVPQLNTTQTVVPGNGFAVDDNGGTQLRAFSLIAQLPDATSASDAMIEVLACSHNFPQTTTCDASNAWWADTYEASALAPAIFSSEPFVQSDVFSELLMFPGITGTVPNLTIPNNGVYGHELSIRPNIVNVSTGADEFFKRLVFIDGTTGEVYTNDALGAAVMLPLQEAAYATAVSNIWNTRYGATAGIDLSDSNLVPPGTGTVPYFVYTAAASNLTIYGAIAYDGSDGQVGCLQPGDCSFEENSAGVAIELKPTGDLSGQMSLAMEGTEVREPTRTLKWTEVDSGAVSCTSIRNPFALTAGGPDYVIQGTIDAGKTWPVSFETGLYYVAHMGYGDCSANDPFCQFAPNKVRRSPRFLPDSGNEEYVTGFVLADPYEFKQDVAPSESTFVWFDNCGYGKASTPDSAGSLDTQRCTLPEFDTQNGAVVQEYTLKNNYPVPIRIEKECCANWWAELSGENGCNNAVFSDELAPPENLRSGHSVLIPQGGELIYSTWFSEEAHVVYNAVTGDVLHKLRLHGTDNWIYDCSGSPITAIASEGGSGPGYTVTFGDQNGSVKCAGTSPYHCAWGMASTTIAGATACVATQSNMILGIQDWIVNRGLTNTTLQTMAWGANSRKSGGFAWTAWEGSYLVTQTTPTAENGAGFGLYVYTGATPGDHNGAPATMVLTEPLSAPGALTGETPATAAAGEALRQQINTPGIDSIVLVAGGAGGSGKTFEDIVCSTEHIDGGTGGTAINKTTSFLTAAGGDGDGTGAGRGGSVTKDGQGGSGSTSSVQNGVGGLAGGESWNTDGANILIPQSSNYIYNSGRGDSHHKAGFKVCFSSVYDGGGGGGWGGGQNGGHEASGTEHISGGGGGGTLAAGISPNASTAGAPDTSDIPSNPGGDNGAFGLAWTTSSEDVMDDSHPCVYSSGYQAVHCAFFASDAVQEVDMNSLEDAATSALQRAKPEANLDGRVHIESWGADGGGSTSVSCSDKAPLCRGPLFGGRGGYASAAFETTDLTTLYLYVALSGQKRGHGPNRRNRFEDEATGGLRGASSVVATIRLDMDEDMQPLDAVGVIMSAGGGGGAGAYPDSDREADGHGGRGGVARGMSDGLLIAPGEAASRVQGNCREFGLGGGNDKGKGGTVPAAGGFNGCGAGGGGSMSGGGTIPVDEDRVFGPNRRLPSANVVGNGLVIIGFATDETD